MGQRTTYHYDIVFLCDLIHICGVLSSLLILFESVFEEASSLKTGEEMSKYGPVEVEDKDPKSRVVVVELQRCMGCLELLSESCVYP